MRKTLFLCIAITISTAGSWLFSPTNKSNKIAEPVITKEAAGEAGAAETGEAGGTEEAIEAGIAREEEGKKEQDSEQKADQEVDLAEEKETQQEEQSITVQKEEPEDWQDVNMDNIEPSIDPITLNAVVIFSKLSAIIRSWNNKLIASLKELSVGLSMYLGNLWQDKIEVSLKNAWAAGKEIIKSWILLGKEKLNVSKNTKENCEDTKQSEEAPMSDQ